MHSALPVRPVKQQAEVPPAAGMHYAQCLQWRAASAKRDKWVRRLTPRGLFSAMQEAPAGGERQRQGGRAAGV